MRFFLALTTILLSVQTWAARVVIVSDIDDTLKIARVRGWTQGFPGALDTAAVFRGMPGLLEALTAQNQAALYYLSNAPEKLMGKLHREFLERNAFPAGTVILRNDLGKDVHKLTFLRGILQRETPETLILLGDNGELDIHVYDTIRRENPRVRVLQYIRTLYSRAKHDEVLPLREGQMSFVGPVEVYLSAADAGLLNPYAARHAAVREAEAYLHSLTQPLPRSGPAYRREWMDFSEHVWRVNSWHLDLPGLARYIESFPRGLSRQGLINPNVVHQHARRKN